MKLNPDEQSHLASQGEVITQLKGIHNLIDYLVHLVERDRQDYTDKVIRPRLGLPELKDGVPDIKINVVKGTVEKIKA